jgi:hypothetical protein
LLGKKIKKDEIVKKKKTIYKNMSNKTNSDQIWMMKKIKGDKIKKEF